MFKENDIKVHGKMSAMLTKADGTVEKTESDNLILNEGFDFICDALAKPASRPDIMKYIAVGTSSTTPAATQGGVLNRIGIQTATYAHTAGTKSFTLTTTFQAGAATGAITEAGVANSSASGTTPIFLDRLTFGVINKEANDVLTVTFTFTFA